jgi:hypothetical protein
MKYLLPLFLYLGCTNFLSKIDNSTEDIVETTSSSESISLIFSGNINGEIKPCGCRKFPLGGFEQAAGLILSEKTNNPVIYVDAGDTFFPSPVIPETVKKSVGLQAETVATGLQILGIRYIVPGEQDFAFGIDYLNKLILKSQAKLLALNLKHESAKPYVRIKMHDSYLYLLGVVSPELIGQKASVTDPEIALENFFSDININKSDRVVLISHLGMDYDQGIAKKFPRINWIIGSHSQSFTQTPFEIGNTKIVQVLSRNHYLGKISLSFSKDQTKDKFEMLETREETKSLIQNNPMTALLARHETELNLIQKSEVTSIVNINEKPNSYTSCVTCHQKQTEFWQSTAHAPAMLTLIKSKAEYNQACIGCHTLGKVVNESDWIESRDTNTKLSDYINAFKNLTPKKSIREMSGSDRKLVMKKISGLHKKFNIKNDFTGVQCLHCHDKSNLHPFDSDAVAKPVTSAKCIVCHTSDQSPTWYEKDAKTLKNFSSHLKQVSCPK